MDRGGQRFAVPKAAAGVNSGARSRLSSGPAPRRRSARRGSGTRPPLRCTVRRARAVGRARDRRLGFSGEEQRDRRQPHDRPVAGREGRCCRTTARHGVRTARARNGPCRRCRSTRRCCCDALPFFQRTYRASWSTGSNPSHSSRLSARHSAIDVSSVHWPGWRWKGPPPTMSSIGVKCRALKLQRRAERVPRGEAEDRAAIAVQH